MPNQKEIRVRNVNDSIHESLLNIAKHHGITMQAFLKPKLREIADSYPEHMHKKPKQD